MWNLKNYTNELIYKTKTDSQTQKISFRNEGEKTFSVEKKTKRLCPKLTSPRGMEIGRASCRERV